MIDQATILDRLDGVRDKRQGNYLACCPAHEDKSPSLSIKFCGDGRVLLHCFAGCDIEAICGALGLRLSDLMPGGPLDNHVKPVRHRLNPSDALAALDHEALVVSLIAADVHEHKEIDEATWNRLARAVNRISTARNACVPRRVNP